MARFEDGDRTRTDEESRPSAHGDGRPGAPRALIADLAEVGYELNEQQLQMVSGGMQASRYGACSSTQCNDVDCD